MRSGARITLLACLSMVVGMAAMVVGWPASGHGVSTTSALPTPSGSDGLPRELVVPSAQWLLGSQQLRTAEQARHANPEAGFERERSRTAFAHLDAARAAAVTRQAFPGVIEQSLVSTPQLPSGSRIIHYLSDNAATLLQPDGKHSVIESFAPIATQTAPGHFAPVDLALKDTGTSFVPDRSMLELRIPKRLETGLELPHTGVSLVPVGAKGASISGAAGSVDGAGVLYANTQPDTDTLVKPSADGFELLAVLRSVDSSTVLRYRVQMPQGATLSQSEHSGAIRVVREGQVLATVLQPAATDAEGEDVPVSMSLAGNAIVVTVAQSASGWHYPIVVDPYVSDEYLTGSSKPTHWQFCASDDTECTGHSSGKFTSVGWGGTGGLTTEPVGGYTVNQSVSLDYETQGESKINTFSGSASGSNPSGNIESVAQLVNKEKVEDTDWLSTPPATSYSASILACAPNKVGEISCAGGEGHEKNLARFEQSAAGSGSSFSDTLSRGVVEITQNHNPEDSFNTTSPTLPDGAENVFYGANKWLGPHNNSGFEALAKDPGIGISYFGIGSGAWVVKRPYLEEGRCSGVQCYPSIKEPFGYSSEMADGERYVEALSTNATVGGFGTEARAMLRVDATPPYALKVTGLPSNGILDGTSYRLRGEATDGSGTTPSSGIKSLALGVDGYQISGGKSGSCPLGPCAASGEWTINGEEFGAGKHKLELVATDNAGNVETKSYEIFVRHASPLSVGPGSIDPITGALTLEANDVSIGGGTGSLGVSRSYNSRQLAAGVEGPLGPQWSLAVSGQEGLEAAPTGGGVTLLAPDGSRTTFTSDGKGGFVAPQSDENLALSAEREGELVKAYILKDPTKGTSVRFIHPSGAGAESLWVVEKSEGSLSKTNGEKQLNSWEALEEEGKEYERPKQALVPALGVSCESELKIGCRALSFSYATETTATGESPSQWGQYKGRLSKVSFTAYNPTSKAMTTTAVAEYSYDKQGRLRAEWDPRISPALKTTYGYDAEGHVVAVSQAGQEPWLLQYGTTQLDPTSGRLTAAVHPPASAALGSGAAPASESKPTLSSTSPVVGTTLSVASNGTWSNSPLTYSYQWKDCDSKENCTAIAGAINQSYTPQARDGGYSLIVTVTAINADGAGTASSAASTAIPLSAPKYASKLTSLGSGEAAFQFKNPVGLAFDGAGNIWIVDHNNNRLDKYTSAGSWVEAVGWGVANGESKLQTCTSTCRAGLAGTGSGELSTPDGIAISGEDIYVADTGNNRIEELNTKDEFVRSFGTSGSGRGQMSSPISVTVAPDGDVWVSDRGNSRIDEFTEGGTFVGMFGTFGIGNGQFKEPSGVAFSGEYVYVVDSGNKRVQQFTQSGEYVAQFGSAGSGNGQFSAPAEIATEPITGDLFVADSGNNRVQEFNRAGSFLSSVGSLGEGEGQFKGVEGIAVTTSGNLYAADLNNNRVLKFTPTYSTNNPLPAPPSAGTSSVTTVDYQVPISGVGAPYALGKTEVEAWAQSDDPVEATAIFPPDEPMGWPAQGYKRASIAYFDQYGRAVNSASPSGAISTTEYNETNNVVRALTADNRAAALKEGSKSAEVSKLLDTQNTYNAEGTELVSTLGPQREIKSSGGAAEKLGRSHELYYYDEGAPAEGGPYNLLTKRVQGDYLVGFAESEVFDKRTTVLSYSGQEGLGWLLRKPTSTTTNPEGLKLTQTTIFNPLTGDVVESRQPGSEEMAQHTTSFGSVGIENGYFKSPEGVATDASGDIYVADTVNNRVQELSSSGAYLRQWGTTGTENGQFKSPIGIAVGSTGNVYVADSANNRIQEFSSTGTYITQFGSSGTGAGQFKGPHSIALDSAGHVWVTDANNSRVEEFSATGEYMKSVGAFGTENGQFFLPSGIAFSSSGNLYVDDALARVQEFSPSGTFIAKFGTLGSGSGQLTAPAGLKFDAQGNLWVADSGNTRIDAFTAAGDYLGSFGSGSFNKPRDLAFDPSGNIDVVDMGTNRVERWSAPFSVSGHIYASHYGSAGFGNGQFSGARGLTSDAKGNIWVADTSNSRVEELSSSGEFIKIVGGPGTGNGQFSSPADVAVDSEGNVWVSDTNRDRIQEFKENGEFIRAVGSEGTTNGKFIAPRGIAVDSSGDVWVADSGNTTSRVQEFSSTGTFIRTFGSFGTENGKFKNPRGISIDASGNVWVADASNNRIQEFSNTGTWLRSFGSSGSGPGQLSSPSALDIEPKTGNVWVADTGNNRIEEFSSTGTYMAEFGQSGTGSEALKTPEGISLDPQGDVLASDTAHDRVVLWERILANVRKDKTIYYSAGANIAYPSCGEHPEWINLPCQTQPGIQPKTGSQLPVVTDTYNILDEPEVVTETFGATTRTKKNTYDGAGRILTSEVTSTVGTSLPKVTDEYSSESGVMVKQSTTVAEKTQTITSVYNRLGQLTEYTDADGNKSTYTYDIDGRAEEMTDGKGSQIYAYDPTTGALTKLLDSAVGTLTASYDVEGKLSSQGYPNGMSAKYTYDPAGDTTNIEYVKETHCTEKCVWFSEAVGYSIHGEATYRSSTLASEVYQFDAAGRMAEVQETPAGKGCVTRLYVYDEFSDRMSTISREPAAEGKCSTTAGTIERHEFEEAGRLKDSGVAYDTFGNTTVLPAADAGGHEITSSYYVSSQTHSTTQSGETITYNLDPTARAREVVSTGITNSTVINHYSGEGSAVAWANEGGEKWTRNVSGIGGEVVATQQNGMAPVLQLHDLQGNIVATAALSETETKLLSTYNSTEFGVPVNGAPPSKLSWLGATGYASEFSSGASASHGAGYVPQLGGPLQTQPIMPPAVATGGTWASGPYAGSMESWAGASSAAWGLESSSREAARQKLAEEEALAAISRLGGGDSEIDPGGCVGIGGLGEDNSITDRKSLPHLNVKCKHADPNAYLVVCVVDKGKYNIGAPSVGTWTCGNWQEIGRSYDNGREFALAVWGFEEECKSEDQYVIAFGYFRYPMRKAEWGYGKAQECHPDGKEYEFKAFVESSEPDPKK